MQKVERKTLAQIAFLLLLGTLFGIWRAFYYALPVNLLEAILFSTIVVPLFAIIVAVFCCVFKKDPVQVGQRFFDFFAIWFFVCVGNLGGYFFSGGAFIIR